MRTRILAISSLLVLVSVAALALYERREMEKMMLSFHYLDTATEIRNNLYILSNLREGRTQEAIKHLEQLLETRVPILEGCKNDLCIHGIPVEYSEPIEQVAKYKTKYQKE